MLWFDLSLQACIVAVYERSTAFEKMVHLQQSFSATVRRTGRHGWGRCSDGSGASTGARVNIQQSQQEPYIPAFLSVPNLVGQAFLTKLISAEDTVSPNTSIPALRLRPAVLLVRASEQRRAWRPAARTVCVSFCGSATEPGSRPAFASFVDHFARVFLAGITVAEVVTLPTFERLAVLLGCWPS